MFRLSGQSIETFRIKNKSIKKGFNSFVLASKNGFVISFSPDGRTAAKQAEDEKMYYETNIINGKFGSMIIYLVESIVQLPEKQKNRFLRTTLQRSTR